MTREKNDLLSEICGLKESLAEIQTVDSLSAGQKLQIDAAIRCLTNALRGHHVDRRTLRARNWNSLEFTLFASAAFFLGLLIGLSINLP